MYIFSVHSGMVMEVMNGGSVQEYLYRTKKNNIITIEETLEIYTKSCSGLKFLHEYGLVHRDIAARNILLGAIDKNVGITKNTLIKISDFGLSRDLESKTSTKHTKNNIGPIKWYVNII